MNRLINLPALSQNKKIFKTVVVCDENNKTVRLECNGSGFYKAKIDDKYNTYLTQNEIRCDYAIVSEDIKEVAILAELKGSDINHAFDQIIASKNKFCKGFLKVYGAVAFGGKIPAGTQEQHFAKKATQNGLKRLFLGRGKLTLKYENTQISR
ncbi:MAG: hypothetical protein ACTTJC_02140 [Campylobacter sp.]